MKIVKLPEPVSKTFTMAIDDFSKMVLRRLPEKDAGTKKLIELTTEEERFIRNLGNKKELFRQYGIRTRKYKGHGGLYFFWIETKR